MKEKEKEVQRTRVLWEKSWARISLHGGASRIHSRLQLIVVASWPRSVVDNDVVFYQRGFVDFVPARTGTRQSRKRDSPPSSEAASDDLLRKKPKSQRRTSECVACLLLAQRCRCIFDDRCKVECHASRSFRGQHALRGAGCSKRCSRSRMPCVSLHDEHHAPQERAAQKRRDVVEQADAELSERARQRVRWEAEIVGCR